MCNKKPINDDRYPDIPTAIILFATSTLLTVIGIGGYVVGCTLITRERGKDDVK